MAKRKSCKAGSRRSRSTGYCRKIKKSRKSCKKGSRRSSKTGYCRKTKKSRKSKKSKSRKGSKKQSRWTKHVVAYMKKHNVSFAEALVGASKTYKK